MHVPNTPCCLDDFDVPSSSIGGSAASFIERAGLDGTTINAEVAVNIKEKRANFMVEFVRTNVTDGSFFEK